MKKWVFSFIIILAYQVGIGQFLDDVNQCSKAKIDFYSKAKNARIFSNYAFPGDGNIDVNYYKLNLDITYTPNYLKGIAIIKAKSTQSSLNQAIIDLQNALTVDSVYVENTKTTFTHTDAKITINLQKSYILNEAFQLTIYYQGKPGSSGFGSFIFGTHGPNLDPAIWSLSEPFGASDWFPCKDNPADKADSSDVWITAPKYFVSVSNGILEEKIENATTNTYKWKSRYPIANYLISIALANYDTYSNVFNYGGPSPMPVDHYFYPETNTPANKLLMDETVFMLNLFTDKFGPYPFLNEKYGHAQFGWGGGMEHQTCTSLVSFGSGLVAHELAHQWFGDKITCQDWANIWLNEGFATFGALIYWEAKSGVATYKTQITSTMNSAKNAVGSVWVQDPTSVGQIFNGARSYSKGGIILHMLRNIVGDTKFYEILRNYTASIHAYGNATTEGFKAIVESTTGQNFDYFFSQWIYGVNYPKYQFGWAVVTNPNGKVTSPNLSYTLRTNITQLVNTNPAFFTMPVSIKITFEDNTSQIVTVFNNAQSQNFDFTFPKKPISVDFDSENGILKDLTIVPYNLPLSLEEETKKITLAGEKYANFEKEIKFKYSPNPAQNQVVIDFELRKPSNFNLEIVDLKGNSVYIFNESKPAKSVKHTISTLHFPTGQYFVKLTVTSNILSKKLMVIH